MAAFEITGEFFTDHVRTRVLEGAWDKALKYLTENLEGMEYRDAVAILTGTKKLIGSSRRDDIDLADDGPDDLETARYIEGVDWLYGSIFKRGDRYFQPYCYIEAYSECDLAGDGRHTIRVGLAGNRIEPDRRYFYADEPKTDIIEEINLPGILPRKAVIAREVDKPPLWLSFGSDFAAAAIKAFHQGRLEQRGVHQNRLLGMAEFELEKERARKRQEAEELRAREERRIQGRAIYCVNDARDEEDRRLAAVFEQELLEIGNKVRQFADEQEAREPGSGWLVFTRDISDDDGPARGLTLRVPRLPFLWWAIRRTGIADRLLPPYEPIATSGIKMQNDDPYHTDWLLGGGYSIARDSKDSRTAYDELMRAAYGEAYDLQAKMCQFPCAVLSGTGYAIGKAVHLKKDSYCMGDEDIAILPSASPEYLKAVEYAKAIIVEQGGAMAHLVNIARERELIIVREEGALSKYPPGTKIFINANNGIISVRE